ncbi:hypothetical protein NFX39_02325 [Fructobacillus sp. W13]|uniref:DUF1642 domain-containing protein n=1 Tax=Fructobacillus apis TaxID=2935017 RepID=A0ABT0ZPN0_9LACO|nr:hypothetical protein [Fructobacillus apis]MCO0831932.1 hypothetical protein [Fructobacillus apis]
MTKKFTEEEYQKIVDCFDKVNKEYNMGLMNPNLLIQIQDELFWGFDFINDWEKIFAIANPATRNEAKEQFVEKEKKYFWKSKNADKNGKEIFITVGPEGYPSLETDITWHALTEREIRKWGYNPDMFYKEEV